MVPAIAEISIKESDGRVRYCTDANYLFYERMSQVATTGVLYVNREHIDTYKERLYALKGSTGAVLWNHTLWQSHTVLAVSGGVAYALSQHALDVWQAGSGSLLWHQALQQVGLLVDGGTVYAGTAGNAGDCFPLTNSKLTALRATDGSQLWQFESGTENSPTLN